MSAFQTALDAYNRDIAADYGDTFDDCFEEMAEDFDMYLVAMVALQRLWFHLQRKNPVDYPAIPPLTAKLRDIIVRIQFYTGFGLDENLNATEHGEDEDYLEQWSDRIDVLVRDFWDDIAAKDPEDAEEMVLWVMRALRRQARHTHNDTLCGLLKKLK